MVDLTNVVLDDEGTGVIFEQSGAAFFEITVMVPVQYTDASITFDNAADASGGFDTRSALAAPNAYWVETFDPFVDPCNRVYTAQIPVSIV